MSDEPDFYIYLQKKQEDMNDQLSYNHEQKRRLIIQGATSKKYAIPFAKRGRYIKIIQEYQQIILRNHP